MCVSLAGDTVSARISVQRAQARREMSEIKCVENPDAAAIAEAKKWSTWDCKPSKYGQTACSAGVCAFYRQLFTFLNHLCCISLASRFPWSYSSTETAYVLEGKVTVTPDGGSPVEVKAGGLYTFPKGMSCTWEVRFSC